MALTKTVSGLKFIKGHMIQALRLADEFVCLCLFLLNTGKVFILLFSITSPFLGKFFLLKWGGFFCFGWAFFLQGVSLFLFVLLISNGEKIKGN